MAQPTFPLYTYSEYLERLEASNIRLEFIDGVVYAMAEGTPEHNRIVLRLTLEVGRQLERPCEAFGPDQKIRARGVGYFPDLSVVCGVPELADDDRNAFTNPSIVFEVLSRSTAKTDLTTKAERYKTLPSLKEYVLVWQEERRVQVHRRTDGRWIEDDYVEADSVSLCCGAHFSVRALYP
jgi:Uma2 family endonuclease